MLSGRRPLLSSANNHGLFAGLDVNVRFCHMYVVPAHILRHASIYGRRLRPQWRPQFARQVRVPALRVHGAPLCVGKGQRL